MKLLKLSHANLKQNNKPVVVYVPESAIQFYYVSPTDGVTHVVCSGNSVFPALESPEVISERIGGEKPSPSRRGK